MKKMIVNETATHIPPSYPLLLDKNTVNKETVCQSQKEPYN